MLSFLKIFNIIKKMEVQKTQKMEIKKYDFLSLQKIVGFELLGLNFWLAGGALRDILGKKEPYDFDLFFSCEEDFNLVKGALLKNGGCIYWESSKGLKISYKNKIFDLVKIFFASPQETIDNFDFTVSMFALDTNNTLFFGKNSMSDLRSKEIIINKISDVGSTLKRVIRYCQKGFFINNYELQKVVDEIKKAPDGLSVLTKTYNFSTK